MNIEFINEFVKLVQTGKFQIAADELYLSQPTLSKHIKALERDLGHELIIHCQNHKLQLTDAGTRFLPYALQISNIYQDIQAEFLWNKRDAKTQIVIGSSPIVPLYSFFEFMDTCANCQIRVINAAPEKLLGMLWLGQCDLVVTTNRHLQPQHGFESITLGEDILSVVTTKDHPCATHSMCSIDEFSQAQFIELSDSGMFSIWNDQFPEETTPLRRIQVGQIATILDMVDNHRGFTLMPHTQAVHFCAQRLAVIDIEPKLDISYLVLYQKNIIRSEAMQALLKHISQPHD